MKKSVLLLLCSYVVIGSAISQNFETIDIIDWSSQSGLEGETINGTEWDARGNDSNNCDNDGFFGVQGDAFVINAWEGTCGCPCGPDDPSTNCGENNSEIDIEVGSAILIPFCRTRIQIPVLGSSSLECGTNDDLTTDDVDLGGCLQPGTDFLQIEFEAIIGDGTIIQVTREICGSFIGIIEETFDNAVFIRVRIQGGTQEVDESYELGDVLIEGLRRDLLANIDAVNHDNNGFICENSQLPLILQTLISPDFDFIWTGPNDFISTDPVVEFSPEELNPNLSGQFTVQITIGSSCIIEEFIDIVVLSAMDEQCIDIIDDPQSLSSIPTLGEWGMINLSLFLLILGLQTIRRRSTLLS